MAYRLSTADEFATAVRTCAREQLAGAIDRLEHVEDDPVEAVHDARKHLKKLRALLRLARAALE
ncbi:MAG: CHAD domain-containing protein, partial [Conexibacter sp.]